MVCQSDMTALLGEAYLFNSTVQVMSAIPQSSQAILTALYRDTAEYGNTALLGTLTGLPKPVPGVYYKSIVVRQGKKLTLVLLYSNTEVKFPIEGRQQDRGGVDFELVIRKATENTGALCSYRAERSRRSYKKIYIYIYISRRFVPSNTSPQKSRVALR